MIRRAAVLALLAALVLAIPASADQRLSYNRAKGAIKAKATRIAGKPTKITALYRLGATVYTGRAEWDRENPSGCAGCGYDPVTGQFYDLPTTESCSVGIEVKLKSSGRLRVSTENFACY